MIDDATQEIVYRNYVDVSVAVASPNGLVVPVLRNVEKMSFAVSDGESYCVNLRYQCWVLISAALALCHALALLYLLFASLCLQDVEKTIGHFGKKAKEGTMQLEDMAGGEFQRAFISSVSTCVMHHT